MWMSCTRFSYSSAAIERFSDLSISTRWHQAAIRMKTGPVQTGFGHAIRCSTTELPRFWPRLSADGPWRYAQDNKR